MGANREGFTRFQIRPRRLVDVSRNDMSVNVLGAEAAGCTAVALTIDLPGGRNTETDQLLAREDDRQCALCHSPPRVKPMFDGLNMRGVRVTDPAMTWGWGHSVRPVLSGRWIY